MEERENQSAEQTEKGENHYELDLDAHSSANLDAAIEDAVAAVGREPDEDTSDGGKTSPQEPQIMSDASDASEELIKMRAERDRLREGLQRTLADLDNFRKRTEREKKSLSRFAVSDVVRDFLEVSDNLERALAASGSAEDLKKGLEMVLKQQDDILGRHGIERIEALNKEFNPAQHEAVLRQESDDVDVPTVSAELQKGYMHYDRLLRPAMVHVTVPTKPAAKSIAEDPAEDDAVS